MLKISKPTTTQTIIILLLAVALTAGFMYTRRTRVSYGPTPTPTPTPTGLSNTPSESLFTLKSYSSIQKWIEYFKDPKLPSTPNVIWQTYIDNEYGFTFKYPESWKIEKESNTDSENFTLHFYRKPYYPDQSYDPLYNDFLTLSVKRGNLQNELSRYSYWADRFNKSGFMPEFIINNVKMFVYNPYLEASKNPNNPPEKMLLYVFFEKDGKVYNFSQYIARDGEEAIIEYLIKTFRFTK